MQEQYAKEIEQALANDLKADFPNAKLKLGHSAQKQPTVSQDIEALKAKLNLLLTIVGQVKEAL